MHAQKHTPQHTVRRRTKRSSLVRRKQTKWNWTDKNWALFPCCINTSALSQNVHIFPTAGLQRFLFDCYLQTVSARLVCFLRITNTVDWPFLIDLMVNVTTSTINQLNQLMSCVMWCLMVKNKTENNLNQLKSKVCFFMKLANIGFTRTELVFWQSYEQLLVLLSSAGISCMCVWVGVWVCVCVHTVLLHTHTQTNTNTQWRFSCLPHSEREN